MRSSNNALQQDRAFEQRAPEQAQPRDFSAFVWNPSELVNIRYLPMWLQNRCMCLDTFVAARWPLRRVLLVLALADVDTEVFARRLSRFSFQSSNA